MAKISELTAANTLDGTEKAPVVQTSTTVRTTAQAIANTYKGTKGADLASAATVDLGAATGNVVHVTGTTTITSFGTAGAGTERTVIFDGVLTLTHNATSLILPTGASITTAAGDTARMMSEGSGNWRCLAYNRKDGTPVGGSTIANDAVTFAKMQNIATQRVIGRNTASSGDPEEVTLSQLLDWSGTTANDDIVQRKSGSWVNRTMAQLGADLQGTGTGSGEVGFRNIPQNSQSAAYTLVAADSGKHIYHPSTDANARTFTIPANSSVAFPIGTAVTFINETSQVVSIAITTDTLVLAGTGSTGTRSLAQYGVATAIKVTSTRWIIQGTGLT